ncbi:MAG: SDR family oxidoreductase [Rhodoferax sp.]|nr:SDR family oxidoreductase [Rhodoferax sp.]
MRTLITGASRGLGQAIAQRLAAPGQALALCASAPSAELERTAALCRARGADVLCLSGDLAAFDTPARLVEQAVAAWGGLDSVVSNAGIVRPGPLGGITQDAWDNVFDVNVRSPWQLAVAAHPHLKASGGAMVVIGSMSGVEPYPELGAYSPAKAALLMLVRVLALEWAADGVRINALSPGLFHTTLTAATYADPLKKAAREALVPMHRIGDPQRDCAGVVAFLLSADAAYMSGQNLVVDGALLGSIQRHLAGRPASVRTA